MSSMFEKCENLRLLDTSNLNMSSALTTRYMFSDCYKLTYLNINKVANDSSYMFQNCLSLTSLDISNSTIHNISVMSYMFYNCSQLEYLDLSSINTEYALNFEYMFAGASNLSIINISNFYVDDNAYFEGMFDRCDHNLTVIVNKDIFNNKELIEIIEKNFTLEYN